MPNGQNSTEQPLSQLLAEKPIPQEPEKENRGGARESRPTPSCETAF